MTKANESRAEWLRDFTLGLRDEFKLTEQDALNRANSLMDRLSALRPADKYYWPGQDKDKRNQDILRSLAKMPVLEVCKQYNISLKRIYSIRSVAMKAQHAQHLLDKMHKK